MQLKSTLMFFALSGTGLGYVVDTFGGTDCSESTFGETVNVWDNTCATGHRARSFIPRAYGAPRQRADFHWSERGCGALTGIQSFWANGDDEYFQIGKCTNLDRDSLSFGSRAG